MMSVDAADIGWLVGVEGIGRGAVAFSRERLRLVEHLRAIAAQRVGEAADVRRHRRGGLRENHVASQRGVVPRHLLLLGRFDHVATHALHDAADFRIRRGTVLEQGGGERAVAPGAVERDGCRAACEHDQRVDGALDLRQPLAGRSVASFFGFSSCGA
jgi:hypothetical protein